VSALVDAFPYPWHLAEARELHVVLCRLYPTAKGALFVAQQAGIDFAFLNPDQPPYMVWKDVLDAGATARKNRPVVELAKSLHTTNTNAGFLEALLQQRSPVSDSEPRGAFGAPAFIDGSDEIREPEALLFHDDLTLPIGRVPWLIDVLQRLQSLAPAVCRLEIVRAQLIQHDGGDVLAHGGDNWQPAPKRARWDHFARASVDLMQWTWVSEPRQARIPPISPHDLSFRKGILVSIQPRDVRSDRKGQKGHYECDELPHHLPEIGPRDTGCFDGKTGQQGVSVNEQQGIFAIDAGKNRLLRRQRRSSLEFRAQLEIDSLE
jgi:hypothetical protein